MQDLPSLGLASAPEFAETTSAQEEGCHPPPCSFPTASLRRPLARCMSSRAQAFALALLLASLGLVTIVHKGHASSNDVQGSDELQVIELESSRASTAWNAAIVPSPQTDPQGCGGFNRSGWICDPDRLLQGSDREELQRIIDSVEAETDYKLMILVVGELSGECSSPECQERKERMEHFTKGTMSQWAVGDGNEGPGVMLAVSMKVRYAYIRVESEPREYLSDSKCKEIVRYHMVQHLESQLVGKGTVAGATEIARNLKGLPRKAWKLLKIACAVGALLFLFVCVCGKPQHPSGPGYAGVGGGFGGGDGGGGGHGF